jgi:hypothetical protein
MSATDVDIERIVRQVLQHLEEKPGSARQNARENTAATGELHVVEPVLTLAGLKGRLDGVRSVAAPRGTVITPAVRDLLKEKGIRLTRTDEPAQQAATSVVLGVAETDYEPAGLVQMLKHQGINTERIAQCGLISAVDELVDAAARGGKIGVLLTGQTAAALCLANRTKGVRAVIAQGAAAVRTARTTVAANLLVTDPQGRSKHELAGIIRACATIRPGWTSNLKNRLD